MIDRIRCEAALPAYRKIVDNLNDDLNLQADATDSIHNNEANIAFINHQIEQLQQKLAKRKTEYLALTEEMHGLQQIVAKKEAVTSGLCIRMLEKPLLMRVFSYLDVDPTSATASEYGQVCRYWSTLFSDMATDHSLRTVSTEKGLSSTLEIAGESVGVLTVAAAQKKDKAEVQRMLFEIRLQQKFRQQQEQRSDQQNQLNGEDQQRRGRGAGSSGQRSHSSRSGSHHRRRKADPEDPLNATTDILEDDITRDNGALGISDGEDGGVDRAPLRRHRSQSSLSQGAQGEGRSKHPIVRPSSALIKKTHSAEIDVVRKHRQHGDVSDLDPPALFDLRSGAQYRNLTRDTNDIPQETRDRSNSASSSASIASVVSSSSLQPQRAISGHLTPQASPEKTRTKRTTNNNTDRFRLHANEHPSQQHLQPALSKERDISVLQEIFVGRISRSGSEVEISYDPVLSTSRDPHRKDGKQPRESTTATTDARVMLDVVTHKAVAYTDTPQKPQKERRGNSFDERRDLLREQQERIERSRRQARHSEAALHAMKKLGLQEEDMHEKSRKSAQLAEGAEDGTAPVKDVFEQRSSSRRHREKGEDDNNKGRSKSRSRRRDGEVDTHQSKAIVENEHRSSSSRRQQKQLQQVMEFAEAGHDKILALMQEQRRLKQLIVAWHASFEAEHGRPPVASDRRGQLRALHEEFRQVSLALRVRSDKLTTFLKRVGLTQEQFVQLRHNSGRKEANKATNAVMDSTKIDEEGHRK